MHFLGPANKADLEIHEELHQLLTLHSEVLKAGLEDQLYFLSCMKFAAVAAKIKQPKKTDLTRACICLTDGGKNHPLCIFSLPSADVNTDKAEDLSQQLSALYDAKCISALSGSIFQCELINNRHIRSTGD